MKTNRALTKWESNILKPSQAAWGVFLLSDMLFGKTDKHWTYRLTVCLYICMSLSLSYEPESYIETLLVWPTAALNSIQLLDHPPLIITVGTPVGVAVNMKLFLCRSHSAKLSLYKALSASACQYICIKLSLFLLSSCCFFSSVWALEMGAWTNCYGKGMCLCTHTPPWSALCLCASMCVRERERQKESVSDKDLIKHDLTVSLCGRADTQASLFSY